MRSWISNFQGVFQGVFRVSSFPSLYNGHRSRHQIEQLVAGVLDSLVVGFLSI